MTIQIFKFATKLQCSGVPGSSNYIQFPREKGWKKQLLRLVDDEPYLFELLRVDDIVNIYFDYECEFPIGEQPSYKDLEIEFGNQLEELINLINSVLSEAITKPFITDCTREKTKTKKGKNHKFYKFSRHIVFHTAVRYSDLSALIKKGTWLGDRMEKLGFDISVYKPTGKCQKMRFMCGKEPGDEQQMTIITPNTKISQHLIQYAKGEPADFIIPEVEDESDSEDTESDDDDNVSECSINLIHDSIDDITKILDYLPTDWADDRDKWIKVGCALHFKATEGVHESTDLFEIWDEWSKKSDNYSSTKDNLKQWMSFYSNKEKPFTFASVVKIAKENGYTKKQEPLKSEGTFRTMSFGQLAKKWNDRKIDTDSKTKDEFVHDIPKVVRFYDRYALYCSSFVDGTPVLSKVIADSRQGKGFLCLPGHITYTATMPGKNGEPIEREQRTSIARYIFNNYRVELLATEIDFKPHTNANTKEVHTEDEAYLNLFIPYAVHDFPEPTDEDYDESEKLFQHIRYLFGNANSEKISAKDKKLISENQYVFACRMLWSMLHNPDHKIGVLLALVNSPEGVGKDALGILIKRIIGSANFLSIPKLSRISRKFNASLEGKQMVIVAEAHPETKDDFEGESVVKDLLTNNTIEIENKGQDPRKYSNHINMLLFSNYADGYVPPKGTRRAVVLEAPQELKPTKYYNDLWNIIDNKPSVIKAFYHELDRRFRCDDYDWTRKEFLPRSAYQNGISTLRDDPFTQLMNKVLTGEIELTELDYYDQGQERAGTKSFHSKVIQEQLDRNGDKDEDGNPARADMVLILQKACVSYIRRSYPRMKSARIEMLMKEFTKKKIGTTYGKFKGNGTGLLIPQRMIKDEGIEL
jgi:hypothetical protein